MRRRPAGWLVTLAIAAVLVLLSCVFVIPQWLVRWELGAPARTLSPADKAKAINDVRTTLLQGVAGLFLIAGAVATWRQVGISRDQLEVVRQQTLESDRQAREQLAVIREGQITERFTRGIEHLGSAKPDVRLGGIYALERIAKDSSPDRGTITAILAAFVRSHARWMVGAPDGPEHPTPTVDSQLPWLEHRAVDVHTAMVVLGRRPPSPDPPQLFLGRVDLRNAYLPDARLSNTSLRHANLARSWMPGVDLENSDLLDADLREANLERARLTSTMRDKSHLQGAHLRKADLQRADLRGANLSAQLKGVDVTVQSANLQETNLEGADLQEADLRGADLRGANLKGANLQGANLQGAQLEGADLTGARHDATTVWPDGLQPG